MRTVTGPTGRPDQLSQLSQLPDGHVPRAPARFVAAFSHPAAAPLAALTAGAAGAAYLWGTDPHESGHFLPRCPFNWATGLLCPACGGTRMTYDLLHGDLLAALHDNAALLVIGLPAAAYLSGRWLYEGLRGRRYRPRLSTRGTVAVLTLAVAWAVARNAVG
ncbi:DUF2752 domain-containing protein [Streptomyces iconiensis]|uniref:DUF2752 domain-containing protein n=1 Tax=Streptomyces iconiensis TaxID=1384038 RepID=A0ABT6ZS67_9ACTN|nr:DUF2752 domain-containing protein [Streptomyces iconiensis]MDJ1131912.1 DUF2752 domain-containing protein [Streptomyces iconiensis]